MGIFYGDLWLRTFYNMSWWDLITWDRETCAYGRSRMTNRKVAVPHMTVSWAGIGTLACCIARTASTSGSTPRPVPWWAWAQAQGKATCCNGPPTGWLGLPQRTPMTRRLMPSGVRSVSSKNILPRASGHACWTTRELASIVTKEWTYSRLLGQIHNPCRPTLTEENWIRICSRNLMMWHQQPLRFTLVKVNTHTWWAWRSRRSRRSWKSAWRRRRMLSRSGAVCAGHRMMCLRPGPGEITIDTKRTSATKLSIHGMKYCKHVISGTKQLTVTSLCFPQQFSQSCSFAVLCGQLLLA